MCEAVYSPVGIDSLSCLVDWMIELSMVFFDAKLKVSIQPPYFSIEDQGQIEAFPWAYATHE